MQILMTFMFSNTMEACVLLRQDIILICLATFLGPPKRVCGIYTFNTIIPSP